VDIVKIDTVLQETTVVDIAGVTVTMREATATGTEAGTGNEVVVVVADVVAAEMVIGMAAVEEGRTMITAADPQGTTTTVDETIAAVTMIMERLAGVIETMDLHMATVVAGEEKAEMEWVRLNEGLRHLKGRYRCLRENGRPPAGMFMLRDTNNIVQCRPSKLVRAGYILYYFSVTDVFSPGLFNLPGANRTQIPPILGIAGLPPPMPVQTFGMGIGSNPNLSRQSRRLYIGSITPDVNEQNLADFFNSKMIEMSIGTGGPGNPVLAVQCNYEKNYAFVEVNLPPHYSHNLKSLIPW